MAIDTIMACPCCGQRAAFKRPVVDLDADTISWKGGTVRFPGTGVEILAVLAKRFGSAVSKEQILAGLYGLGESPETAPQLLHVYVCQLRKVLPPIGLNIETVWGYGFKLVQTKEDASAAA